MCDERTSAMGHGYGIDSNSLISPDSSSATLPNCPALGQQCLWPASCVGQTNKDLSVIWEWGTADSVFPNNGLETGFLNGRNLWVFGSGQLIGFNPLAPSDTTNVLGKWLGCPTSPTTDQTFGDTNMLTRRYFAGCANSPNPSSTALGQIKAQGGGHQPEGYDGLDAPAEMWSFWSSYPG